MSIEPYKVDDFDENVISSQHQHNQHDQHGKAVDKKEKLDPVTSLSTPSTSSDSKTASSVPLRSLSVSTDFGTSSAADTGTTNTAAPRPIVGNSSSKLLGTSSTTVPSTVASSGTSTSKAPGTSAEIPLVSEADPEAPPTKNQPAKAPTSSGHHPAPSTSASRHSVMRIQPGLLMPSPSAEHRFRNHRTRDLVTPEEGDEDEEDDDSPSVGTTLMAGAVAGAISKTVVAPLERAKIYFMTNEQVRFRLRKMVKWLKFSYRTEVRERYII